MIDLSADFRLKNPKIYNKYYGIKHKSLDNLKKSVYGLSEINKKNLSKAKIIACPGCYPTSILLPLFPLIKKNLIDLRILLLIQNQVFLELVVAFIKNLKIKIYMAQQALME